MNQRWPVFKKQMRRDRAFVTDATATNHPGEPERARRVLINLEPALARLQKADAA